MNHVTKIKCTSGNSWGFIMETIAYIISRLTTETRVAHISTVNRYYRSRQEAAIHLCKIFTFNYDISCKYLKYIQQLWAPKWYKPAKPQGHQDLALCIVSYMQMHFYQQKVYVACFPIYGMSSPYSIPSRKSGTPWQQQSKTSTIA